MRLLLFTRRIRYQFTLNRLPYGPEMLFGYSAEEKNPFTLTRNHTTASPSFSL